MCVLGEGAPPATLYALGNSVDSVAGFVGHRNSQVTSEVYIAMSRTQHRQMLDVPWLRDLGDGGALRREAEACAAAICSPFGSADGRTFPTLEFPPPAGHHHLDTMRCERAVRAARDCLRDTADLVSG